MQTTHEMHTARLREIEQLKAAGEYDITDAIKLNRYNIGMLLLRVTIGALMLIHGINKVLYGTEAVENILTSAGIPSLFTPGVIIGEVVGPIMMIIGWKTQIGAAFVAIDMLMAVLLVHAGQLTQMTESGGWMLELNALYLFGALAVIFLGSGEISVSKGYGPLD